jgi:hypothetical protein
MPGWQTHFELNSEREHDAEWIAIVCGAGLLRLQFQRLLLRKQAKIFENLQEARVWLLSESGRG